MENYLGILVLLLLASGFTASILALSIIVGPRKDTEKKDDPFECGTVSSGGVGQRHGVRFYLVAVTFIIFDLEIIFLYPWAVSLKQLGWYGFFAMLPFVLLLALGLAYEWKRGALEV